MDGCMGEGWMDDGWMIPGPGCCAHPMVSPPKGCLQTTVTGIASPQCKKHRKRIHHPSLTKGCHCYDPCPERRLHCSDRGNKREHCCLLSSSNCHKYDNTNSCKGCKHTSGGLLAAKQSVQCTYNMHNMRRVGHWWHAGGSTTFDLLLERVLVCRYMHASL